MSNPIGTEYIIMEHAVGVRLHDAWPTMNVVQHLQCIRKLSMVMEELAKISFPAYGSLYFNDAPIEPNAKVDFVDEFCVGPHCGTKYWDVRVGEDKFYGGQTPNRGPCKSSLATLRTRDSNMQELIRLSLRVGSTDLLLRPH